MNSLNRVALGMVVLLVPGCASTALKPLHGQSIEQSPEWSELIDELEDLSVFGFSGAVLVSDSAGVRVRQGFGKRAPNGVPNDANTLFDIGSLGKQFTAAAIFALEEEGALALEDTVGRFFPEAPDSIAAIRVDQLLAHTSGLPRGNLTKGEGEEGEEWATTSRDSALARVFRAHLRFPPGSDRSYSNAGYVLLAAIVEEASGEDYNAYVHRRLFDRAGLQDTRFWGEPGAPAAIGFDGTGILFDPNEAPLENWSLRGGGGVLSSISDLERWMDALTSGAILSNDDVRTMMSAQAGDYGFGWRIGEPGTRYANSVYHGGDFVGFGSQLVWFPASRRLIVVLANVRHEDNEYPTRLVAEDAIFASIDGEPRVTPQVTGPAVSPTELSGRYQAEDGSSFEVSEGVFGLELSALDQQAVKWLWNPEPDSAASWDTLNDRAAAIVAATLRGDSAAMRPALAPTDDPPYVFEQLSIELRDIRGDRERAEVRALGTWPATPTGLEWTVVEISTNAGLAHYRLRWDPFGNVGSYHIRSPRSASAWPLAEDADGWVAWDLVHRPTPVSLSRGTDAETLLLRGSAGTTVLKRVE